MGRLWKVIALKALTWCTNRKKYISNHSNKSRILQCASKLWHLYYIQFVRVFFQIFSITKIIHYQKMLCISPIRFVHFQTIENAVAQSNCCNPVDDSDWKFWQPKQIAFIGLKKTIIWSNCVLCLVTCYPWMQENVLIYLLILDQSKQCWVNWLTDVRIKDISIPSKTPSHQIQYGKCERLLHQIKRTVKHDINTLPVHFKYLQWKKTTK